MLCPLSYEGTPSNLCRVGLGRTVRNYDRDARVEAISLTDKQNPASPRGGGGENCPKYPLDDVWIQSHGRHREPSGRVSGGGVRRG